MAMKFVQKIMQNVELKSAHGLAKALTELSGKHYSHQKVMNWLGTTKRDQRGINLTDLCRLRRLSGETWEQFGADLDNEFLK